MGQQSNNNFDELFQKAAEDYPLKTDNQNWDIVAAKLRATPFSLIAKTSKKWQYALLLLLLFSTAGGLFIYHFSNKAIKSNNKSNITTGTAAQFESTDSKNKQIITNNKYQQKTENNSQKNSLAEEQVYQKPNLNINNKIAPGITADIINHLAFKPIKLQSLSALPALYNKNENNKFNQVSKENSQLINNNAEKNNTQNNKANNIKSTTSQHVKLKTQPKTFYGALFFSPNFSAIKFQNVNSPGYKAGIALGYRLSTHFNVELGVQRVHTYFFTDAKYLDESHLKYKPNTNIQSVNGKSKLTEVPFDIRYNFSKTNDHFFTTIGATLARITHTEKYNYFIKKDGAPREVSKHFGAITGTKFLSDVNFSMGYQTPVYGNVNLKVEPYYQIPLKGLGVGNLPVSNFGINVGIVKDFK